MPQPAQPGALLRLGMAFNVATVVVALPVYDATDVFNSPDPLDLTGLVLLLLCPSTLLVFVAGELVARSPLAPRWSTWFWTGLLFVGLVSAARVVQHQAGIGLGGLPLGAQLATGLALVLVFLFAGLLAMRMPLLVWFGKAAPIFALVSVYFGFATLSLQSSYSPTARALARDPEVPSRQDSVFILLFDELGRDVLLTNGSIDGDEFPHFKTLAARGAWFSNATSNYYWSCHSIPSLMSGSYVAEVSLNLSLWDGCFAEVIPASTFTLLRLLASEYRVSVYGTYLRDCQFAYRFICGARPYSESVDPLATLARHWLPRFLRPALDTTATSSHDWQFNLYRDFLADIGQNRARGRVYFVHLLLPHWPFEYDATGARHFSPYQEFRGEPGYDSLAYQNYRQQVRLVDSLLGQLIDTLKARGLYETSTIVVTGDHGPRPPLSDQANPALDGIGRETPYIPVIIRSPDLAPQVVSRDYQHVDLAPTLLEVLDLPSMPDMDGTSAWSDPPRQRSKQFSVGNRHYVLAPGSGNWVALQGDSSPDSGSP